MISCQVGYTQYSPIQYDYSNLEGELCCNICKEDEIRVFDFCEVMPSFNGNLETELANTISIEKKLKYRVGFIAIVNCNGEINDFKKLYGDNDQLNSSLLQSLKNLQKWSPAQQAGKNVDCKKIIHIELKRGKLKIL